MDLRNTYRRINFEMRRLKKARLSEEEAQRLIFSVQKKSAPTFVQKNTINKICDLMIVVPIYNVERYLAQCLDSVFAQETQYGYNVIAVDDGSTDSSGAILERYGSHKNLTIIHQENQGFSGARNRALKSINASYVMFLDADDYLPSDAVQKLLTTAFECNADIVQGSYTEFDEKGIIRTVTFTDKKSEISPVNLSGFTCMKIFRAELLTDFCFPAGFLYEDTVIAKLLYPICQTAISIPDVIYFYRQHKQSISSQPQTPNNIDTYWITKYCLEEEIRRGYAMDEGRYVQYLQQCWVNFARTWQLSEGIQESIFVLTRQLFQQYFPHKTVSGSERLKLLHRAFQSNSYCAYHYLLERWNLI